MAKPLAPGDAFFLMVESDETPNHVGILSRFSLPKGKDKTFILDMVRGFREHQPKDEPFNLVLADRKITAPLPAWEKSAHVDIDYHLRHSALPQPGTERELAVLISRLHSIPLDHSRPMWECHVIEGLENDQFAIYAKMHHALVDGVAGARMVARWMSTDIKAGKFEPWWAMPKAARKPRSADASSAATAQSLIDQFKTPAKAASNVFGALTESVKGQRSKKIKGLVAPYSAPNSMLNCAVGPQRRVSTIDFDIQRLLTLGKTLGGTLNDVVMTICGTALRSYLLEQNDLPNKPLTAQVPVSIRAGDDQGGGNAISMLLSSLATDEVDTIRRFEKVKQSMTAGKTLLRGMSKSEITTYTSLLMLPFTLGQTVGIGNRSARPMFNVVISNVPGPKEKRYLNGAECVSMHPVSFVMQGQALNITLFSYGDVLSFVYIACRESLPSVQRLVNHTQAAVEELEKAAGIKPAKPAAAKKKAPAKRKTAAKKPAPAQQK